MHLARIAVNTLRQWTRSLPSASRTRVLLLNWDSLGVTKISADTCLAIYTLGLYALDLAETTLECNLYTVAVKHQLQFLHNSSSL